MIVDSHTHLGDMGDEKAVEYWNKTHRIPDWVAEPYLQAMQSVDRAIVIGIEWGPPSVVSNECVAHFVREHSKKFILYCNVNPKSPTALYDLERAAGDLGAKGIKLYPIYQDFKPDDEQYFPFYAKIDELGLPIVWHQGTSADAPEGQLEWANPVLLDQVARTFPNLKMAIAHLGFPWVREVVALLRKRPNVFADVSALSARTWVLYNALVDAVQYKADSKVFFGSDYPMCTPAQMRDALYQISAIPEGTNLPQVSKSIIEGILHRNCLNLLGIE